MKVAAFVLTFQARSTGRLDLLQDTVVSLGEADSVRIVDNGSTDGTVELLQSYGGVWRPYVNTSPLHTSGAGNNLMARMALATDADLVVFSDDDMKWREGWRAALERWWIGAPAEVALTGAHIEPLFPWNKVHQRIEVDGIPGLIRDSTGAASWTMRHRDIETLFGPVGIWQQHQGLGDVMACNRLRGRGRSIAQIDLAEHRGQGHSTWGNKTESKYGWDSEPAFELLNGVSV